jgi:hypothetical protein
MLNVITFWKLTFPALYNSIKFWYNPKGELPVGQPNLKGFSLVGFAALILSATYLAAHLDNWA